MNTRNFGIAKGRLTRNPHVEENRDGSKTILFSLAVRDNFKSTNRETGEKENMTQFLNFRAFLPQSRDLASSVYSYMDKGDQIDVHYSVRSSQYEKDGQKVYDQYLHVESIDLAETKASKTARIEAEAELAEVSAEDLPFA